MAHEEEVKELEVVVEELEVVVEELEVVVEELVDEIGKLCCNNYAKSA